MREIEQLVDLRTDGAQGDHDEDRERDQGSQADADEPLVVGFGQKAARRSQ